MRRLFPPYLIYSLLLLAYFIWPTHHHAQADVSLVRLHTLNDTTSALDAVAFSPDGTRMASGGRDHVIRVWDTASGELLMQTEGHSDWITALTFSPNGVQIISGSRDNTIRAFNADSGALIGVIGGHDDDVTAVTMSPDGVYIVSGGRDGYIKVWDTRTGALVETLDHFDQAVWHLAFDPSGIFLASASEDGTIWLWGLWDPYHTSWLKRLSGHDTPTASLAFAPDGSILLSGGLDGTVRLWDLRDLSEATLQADLIINGHLAPVMGVGISQDGQVGLSASLDGTLRLWDLAGIIESGYELARITVSGAPLTALGISADQAQIASTGTDGALHLWDTSTDALTRIVDSQRPLNVANNPTNSIQRAIAPPNEARTYQLPVPEPASGRLLTIPSAGVSVGVTTFPLDGVSWAIDPWEPIVGHFQGTAWLNQTGNMVLGGHSEMPDGSRGIFGNLYNVGIGDEIFVQDAGITRRYVVVNILSVDYRDISVVYPTAFNRLTLVTCDIPSYIAEQNFYYERLVIIADEVPL
ncbi:MAG: sortase domain-containing protein [Anaerolineae bacterium]